MASERRLSAAYHFFDALTPTLKAYITGYIAWLAPRLPQLLQVLRTQDVSVAARLSYIRNILYKGLGFNRLPIACAIILAGATVIPTSILRLIQSTTKSKVRVESSSRQIGIISCFLCAWFAFRLLNNDQNWIDRQTVVTQPSLRSRNSVSLASPRRLSQPKALSGKTIDLTSFAFCRAVDVVVAQLWRQTRPARQHNVRMSRATTIVQKLADPCVFAGSAAVIMWSWFYAPERLPLAYQRWIAQMAEIDPTLIEALRLCRRGDFVYGEDTGNKDLLRPLCRKLNFPDTWADPRLTVPIPCALYHCGHGRSCESHAIQRFLSSYVRALKVYVPLQLIGLMRHRRAGMQVVRKAFRDVARSSTFLAAFVASFYYGVCLSRTRLGPKLFSRTTVTPQMWDAGLCIFGGCLTCGWSILLEQESRRQEMSLFVAARAVSTLFPRVYERTYQYREQLVFASCVTIVMSAATSGGPARGAFGKLLRSVLN